MLTSDADLTDIAELNPFRYRGYYYDTESSLYYLNSRYYDPETGRFVNADAYVSTGQGLSGNNMFAYCGNDPINRADPAGTAWWHWAVGATVVAACAVATVITCGGFASALTAVCLVGNGVAATTTASTIAAGAFIDSSLAYGSAVISSAFDSNTIQEFYDQGSWYTVAFTLFGAVVGGYDGRGIAKSQIADDSEQTFTSATHTSGVSSPKKNTKPNGSYTQLDSKGNIYSYAQYDNQGRQTLRIDFQGRPHAGVSPHIHLYIYPERGGRMEFVFDLNWILID